MILKKIDIINAPKKIICLVILLLSCITCSWSQVNYVGEELAVGVRLGGTISSVSFQPSVAQQQLVGIAAGAVFRYSGEKNLGIQVEGNFMQRGWLEKTDSYTFSRQMDFIELSLLTHVFFGKKSFRWLFNIGPNVAFLINESHSKLPKSPEYQHTSPFKNNFDYGICVGTGFEINTRRAGIYQLEGRYNFGLGDFFGNTAVDTFTRSAHRNITIAIGLLFNVK